MQESFPSINFAQRTQSAQTKIARFRADLEALELRLEKLGRNTETLEVAGKDPEAEIRRARADIAKVKIEIVHAQESLQAIFSEERSRFTLLRKQIWSEECADPVSTSTAKLVAAAAAVRSICTAINAVESTKSFDDGIAEFNRLALLFGLPGNFYLSPSDSLTLTFQSAVRSALANSGLVKAIEDLRVALKLDPDQSGTLTKAAQEFGRQH